MTKSFRALVAVWTLTALSFFMGVPGARAASVDALIEKLVEKKILTRIDA